MSKKKNTTKSSKAKKSGEALRKDALATVQKNIDAIEAKQRGGGAKKAGRMSKAAARAEGAAKVKAASANSKTAKAPKAAKPAADKAEKAPAKKAPAKAAAAKSDDAKAEKAPAKKAPAKKAEQDVAKREPSNTITMPRFGLNGVDWASDGERLIFSPYFTDPILYSAQTGLIVRQLKGHTYQVNAVAFSPDSNYIASGAADARVIIWDALTGDSLRVLGAVYDGRLDPASLTQSDRDKIERNIVERVLNVARYPEIRFEGSAEDRGQAIRLVGKLVLHGRSRPLTVHLVQSNGRMVAEVELHQPDFGITPYSAMLGALRVQADVRVRIDVPAPG